MFDEQFRQSLKVACKFFGGQKAVAQAAHIKESNFSKWLQGGPTLSPENIDTVLQVMGLPDGKPDTSRVHVWHVNKIEGIDFTPALKLYFPNGGEIAKSDWAIPDIDFVARSRVPLLIYGMTDGHVRAILRRSLKGHYQWDEHLISHLKWRNGNAEDSELIIFEKFSKWAQGLITQKEFDFAWNNEALTLGAQRVLAAIDQLGITYEEAIQRIRRMD